MSVEERVVLSSRHFRALQDLSSVLVLPDLFGASIWGVGLAASHPLHRSVHRRSPVRKTVFVFLSEAYFQLRLNGS